MRIFSCIFLASAGLCFGQDYEKWGIKEEIKVGATAPAFDIQTLDGEKLSLSTYSNQWVLIDFCATWCPPCHRETQYFEDLWEDFGNREDLGIMTIWLDPFIKAPKDYYKKKKQPWIQGYGGAWKKSDVAKAYGVRVVPSIVLINPEGKIVETGLREARTKQALEKHVGKPNPPAKEEK